MGSRVAPIVRLPVSKMLPPMRPRDPHESHRAATPLELFFDLTFVVAVSLASIGLADQIGHHHGWGAVGNFVIAFFAVWWGWLNFTWFASAYDSDDWLYRVMTLVQMGGALTVAAGIPDLLDKQSYGTLVVGYVIMRVAMGCQWLRAAHADPDRRVTALKYAVGIWLVQIAWVLRLLASGGAVGIALFVLLVIAELAVPLVAERHAVTPYHPEHVAERYGLFTIIVLGEGVLASTNAVIAGVHEGEHVASLVTVAVCGLIILAGMWWFYFEISSRNDLASSLLRSMVWGYGHFFVFAAAAAVSSGIELQIERVTGHTDASRLAIGFTLAVPIAVFLFATWLLIMRPYLPRLLNIAVPALAVLTLLAALLPVSDLAVAIAEAALLVVLIAMLVIGRADARSPAAAA
jgi:low temperature requirement protein LtrA